MNALMLADGDLSKQRLLLDRGARINAATQSGRTAVFLAAMRDPSADTVKLLVSRGADLKIKDASGNTMLAAAAAGNDLDTIRMMLDAGVDVNAGAVTGMTPLMLSAGQRNLEAVKLMLAKHANVNAICKDPGMEPGRDPKSGPIALSGYTALHFAVAQGPADLVAALLDAGAAVDAVESRKLSPLMIAVAADHQNAAVIKLLLARGASPSLGGSQAGTAVDWAAKIGAPDAIALLHATKPTPAAVVMQTSAPPDAKSAVERGIALLETSSQGFYEKSGSVACHAQAMTDMAVGEARLKGLRINTRAVADRGVMYDTASFPPMALHERGDIMVPEIVAYTAAGMFAAGHAPDRNTDAMALNIASQQSRDGAWHQQLGIQERPGGEDGDFARTALSIHALVSYGPPGRKAEMTSRVARARLAHTRIHRDVRRSEHAAPRPRLVRRGSREHEGVPLGHSRHAAARRRLEAARRTRNRRVRHWRIPLRAREGRRAGLRSAVPEGRAVSLEDAARVGWFVARRKPHPQVPGVLPERLPGCGRSVDQPVGHRLGDDGARADN